MRMQVLGERPCRYFKTHGQRAGDLVCCSHMALGFPTGHGCGWLLGPGLWPGWETPPHVGGGANPETAAALCSEGSCSRANGGTPLARMEHQCGTTACI